MTLLLKIHEPTQQYIFYHYKKILIIRLTLLALEEIQLIAFNFLFVSKMRHARVSWKHDITIITSMLGYFILCYAQINIYVAYIRNIERLFIYKIVITTVAIVSF